MIVWILFLLGILVFLALDLGVFNKKAHVISVKEASFWTAVWVTLSLLFTGVIYWLYGTGKVDNVDGLTPMDASLKYITGYLIELSLSIDNIFVIAVIFTSFQIPQKYQHRVLFWGILGAIIFRALMIFFGVALIKKFSFTTYIFGAFLIFTALRMLFSKEETLQPEAVVCISKPSENNAHHFADARTEVFHQTKTYNRSYAAVHCLGGDRVYRYPVCFGQRPGYFGDYLRPLFGV